MPPSNTTFDPDAFMEAWSDEKFVPSHENGFSFKDCITKAFNLPENDPYVYRAQAVTTLDVTQRAINGKRAHGLHGWYHDDEGKPLPPPLDHPDTPTITSYTSLFHPTPSLPKALNAFLANSKPATLRHTISTYLSSRFHYNPNALPAHSLPLIPPKKSRTHTNPYLSLWTYSTHELEYAGPTPSTTYTRISHHMLPIFYHHFGCIVPSYAALHVIAKLAQPAKPSKESVRPILDVGSGSGYWTYMLRHFPPPDGSWKALEVHAVDNQLSEYRVNWVGDTIISDGVKFLEGGRMKDGEGKERSVDGGRGCVLLLVYPQATGGFTEKVLRAFRGDTIVVAGTQNGNGFTGFRDCVVDEWVERNLGRDSKGEGGFELVLRMPLPSFAGKDEALFVFQRRKGAA